MDYKKNLMYFSRNLIIIPIILIIFALFLLGGRGWFFGLLIGGGAGYWIYVMITNSTDASIDAAASGAIQNIKDKALKKLGLDADQVTEIDPIIFEGYYFRNLNTQFLVRKGKDGLLRSSNYQVTVFFFSGEQVYCYEYMFSLIAKEQREATDEYFYRDIVSISTVSEDVKFLLKKLSQIRTVEQFKLTTTGGTSISAAIKVNDSSVERSINGMKQLLRNKKMN